MLHPGVLVVWHGNEAQVLKLLSAIECHCPNAPCHGTCPAHQGLLSQRWMDGLLFALWMRERLLLEEWRP